MMTIPYDVYCIYRAILICRVRIGKHRNDICYFYNDRDHWYRVAWGQEKHRYLPHISYELNDSEQSCTEK